MREEEKRMTMSMAESYFTPQCCSCHENDGGRFCKAWKKQIPENYKWNQDKCPKYNHRERFDWPAIQKPEEAARRIAGE